MKEQGEEFKSPLTSLAHGVNFGKTTRLATCCERSAFETAVGSLSVAGSQPKISSSWTDIPILPYPSQLLFVGPATETRPEQLNQCGVRHY